MTHLRLTLRVAAALVAAFLIAPSAFAQAVTQSGPILNGGGHAPVYMPASPQGAAQVMDSGPAGGGPIGTGLSEKLLQAKGPGTGPDGTHDCDYSAYVVGNPSPPNRLCWDANALGGGGLIDFYSPTGQPLTILVNGVPTTLPFTSAGFPLNPAAAPFNCKGNGTANDTPCWQTVLAACGAAPGGSISIPPGFLSYVNQPLSDNGKPCIIHGNNPTNGNDNGACTSGFTDVAGGTPANINILTLTGTGSKIDHTCILAGANGNSAASGTALTIGAPAGGVAAQQAADFNVIKFSYICIAGGGQTGTGYGGGTNSLHLTNNWCVSPVYGGALIGQLSNNASTTSVIIENNRVTCVVAHPAVYGIAFFDAALDTFYGNEENNCDYGTAFIPGTAGSTGQVVLGEGLTGVIGDSSQINDILINATTSAAHVVYLTFVGWWAGMNTTSTGPGVLIENTGGGVVQNIAFTGGVAHGSNNADAAQNVFDIEGAVEGVTITGNEIAADGGNPNDTGIYYNGQGTGIVINGNNFDPNEAYLASALTIASTANANSNITFVNNNLSNTFPTPINYLPAAVNFLFNSNNNYPGSMQTEAVPSASSLIVPAWYDFVAITGTTTVNTIGPWWQVRHIRLRLNSSGLTLAAGTDGMCNSFTSSSAGQGLDIYWNPNLACWDQGG